MSDYHINVFYSDEDGGRRDPPPPALHGAALASDRGEGKAWPVEPAVIGFNERTPKGNLPDDRIWSDDDEPVLRVITSGCAIG